MSIKHLFNSFYHLILDWVFQGAIYLISFLGIIAAIIFTIYAWPVSIYCYTLTLLWFLVRKSTTQIVKSLKNLCLPLIIGSVIVSLALFVLNISKNSVAPQKIRSVEIFLIETRMCLRGVFITKMWFEIIAIILLCICEIILDNRKLLAGYSRIQRSLSFILLMITCIVSFTFFSQIPMENLAQNEYQQMVDRYKVSLRQQLDAVAEYLTTSSLQNTFNSLTLQEKKEIIIVCKEINKSSKWLEVPKSRLLESSRSKFGRNGLKNLDDKSTLYLGKQLSKDESHLLSDKIIEKYQATISKHALTLDEVKAYKQHQDADVSYNKLDESIPEMPDSRKDWETLKRNVYKQEDISRKSVMSIKKALNELDDTMIESCLDAILEKIEVSGMVSSLKEIMKDLIIEIVKNLKDLLPKSNIWELKRYSDIYSIEPLLDMKTAETFLLPSNVVKPFIVEFVPSQQNYDKNIVTSVNVNKSQILESSILQGKAEYKNDLVKDKLFQDLIKTREVRKGEYEKIERLHENPRGREIRPMK